MAISRISIPIDEDTARLYAEAGPEDQKKLRLLVSLWIRDLTGITPNLKQVMDEVSEKAESRGLTPEILEQILSAE